jgi:hypothetical protein
MLSILVMLKLINKVMCFKWFKHLFGGDKIDPPTWEHADKVALLFGINDYGGGNNDLRGCLNDINLVANKLTNFQIRKFENGQVTKANLLAQVNYAIANSVVGDIIYIHYSGHGTYVEDRNGDELDGYDEALYLVDGPLVDDDLNNALRAIPDGVFLALGLDSCFSGTATRGLARGRFMQPSFDMVPHLQVKHKFYDYMSWVVLSACAENQTAADAEINGDYYGAFSFYAFNCLLGNMTYQTWFNKIREFLPSRDFDQAPTLEGDSILINKLVLT